MIVNLRQEVLSPCADFSSGRLRLTGAAARSPPRMDISEVGERMLFRWGRRFLTTRAARIRGSETALV